MPRSQDMPKKESKKPVTVISNKTPKVPKPVKAPPGVTLRTVHYIEVGELEPKNVQLMVQELNATYNPAEQGIHFVIPMRNGKIGADVVFEEEFLKTVQEVCEVNDEGEIVLKDGAREVTVMRARV